MAGHDLHFMAVMGYLMYVVLKFNYWTTIDLFCSTFCTQMNREFNSSFWLYEVESSLKVKDRIEYIK